MHVQLHVCLNLPGVGVTWGYHLAPPLSFERCLTRSRGPRLKKKITEHGKGLGALQRQTTIEPVPEIWGLLRIVGGPYPFAIGLTHKYLALQPLAFIRTAVTASRRLKGTSSISESRIRGKARIRRANMAPFEGSV